MAPKVSVIIPVYNTERHLPECLESVLSQTLKDIEVIIVDDGSTDGSLAIAKRYAQKDSRIRVLEQENCNAGAARNLGLAHSTGEYLSFLDSDDFFDPTMLDKAYEACERQKADVAVFRTRHYVEDESVYKDTPWTIKAQLLPGAPTFKFDEVKENAFFAILGYTWDKLFKRSLIESSGIRFQSQPVFNDAYFTYSALMAASKIVLLDEVLVTQRKRTSKDSISDRRSSYWTCSYTLLRGIKDRIDSSDLPDKYRRDFINYAVHMLLLDLETKSGSNRDYMEEAIKRYWSDDLGITPLLTNSEYFYDRGQWRRFKGLLESPLRHSPVPTLEEICPAEAMPSAHELREPVTIPVAFATDEGYLYPTAVAIASMLERAYPTTTYKIYVLVDAAFSKASRQVLADTCERFGRNDSIEFIVPDNRYDEAGLFISHITTATYYRLSLPSLLPNVDRCLYLDSDIVVRGDLSELFDTPMEDIYIAGVRAFTYFQDERMINRKKRELGVDTWDVYVNAGVLLLNLGKIRHDGLEEKFTQLLGRNFSSQDQDILNLACRNHIKMVPFKYNVMTKYDLYSNKVHGLTYLKDWVDRSDWDEGRLLPVIIHYADKKKPWNDVSSLYAEAWWDVAKRLPEDIQAGILSSYIDSVIGNVHKDLATVKTLEKRQQRLLNYLRYWSEKKISQVKRKAKKWLGR